jgi:hypothetical protein
MTYMTTEELSLPFYLWGYKVEGRSCAGLL